MNKKLFISAFLMFSFVFSSVMLAEEKDKTIEQLVWADTLREMCFYLEPVDDFELETFESDPFLTFHVPASPKNSTLFFEIWAQAFFEWSGRAHRIAKLRLMFRIISDDIPDDIEVLNGGTVIHVRETNWAGDYDIRPRRSPRNWKQTMRRDAVDWWNVYYKSTLDPVPENIAKKILKDLIANGFDIEVYTDGEILGVNCIYLIPVEFEVTRISR